MRRAGTLAARWRRALSVASYDDVLRFTSEVTFDGLAGMRLRLLGRDLPEQLPAEFDDAWWAMLWPGGHALANHVTRHPERFRGRRVVDLGSGCGVGAIAAAMAGASEAVANDICKRAAVAATLNAGLNGVRVATLTNNIIGSDPANHFSSGDALIVGDVLYEADVTGQMLPWLQRLATFGVEVTVADPGRPALLDVPSTQRAEMLLELEEVELPPLLPASVSWDHYGCVRGTVWRVLPCPA